MPSKAEKFERYAEECQRRADTAIDPQARAVFRDMAVQWRELASSIRNLRADAARTEDFFKRRSPSRRKAGS